jgi:YD repeat-containing protein
LATNTYYNHRGLILEVSSPALGGPAAEASARQAVLKYQYDGAGRTTITYTTDGASGSGWSNAGSVSSDNVLEQVETTYDANSNVIETIDRQRFHDQTSTGALGTPTSGVLARVYFTATYYDKADRPTDTVDVGTNGGSAWTRPSSVPSRSDTALVSSETYNAAGWVDSTTDPKGIVNKNFYDNLGEVTKTIQDYTTGTPTNSSDKTTEYTFDGDGHMLTL